MKIESIDQIISFLKKIGIKASNKQVYGKFNRIVEFELENRMYYIEWWVNQSYLRLYNDYSVPHIPFKYIGVNQFSPNTIHHDQLCFYDKEIEVRRIPFGAFKIPFNIKNTTKNGNKTKEN